MDVNAEKIIDIGIGAIVVALAHTARWGVKKLYEGIKKDDPSKDTSKEKTSSVANKVTGKIDDESTCIRNTIVNDVQIVVQKEEKDAENFQNVEGEFTISGIEQLDEEKQGIVRKIYSHYIKFREKMNKKQYEDEMAHHARGVIEGWLKLRYKSNDSHIIDKEFWKMTDTACKHNIISPVQRSQVNKVWEQTREFCHFNTKDPEDVEGMAKDVWFELREIIKNINEFTGTVVLA